MKKYFRKIMDILRRSRNEENRGKLKNKDITIISSNCVGGVISHELGLKFLSPTVNLYIEPGDFVKFCMNLSYYLNQPLIHIEKQNKYPTALCGDIKIHGLHYKNFLQLEEKWNERKQRVNVNNLFLIMIERDGCTYENIVKFDNLTHKNKVVFVTKSMPEIKSAIYIPEVVVNKNGIIQVDTMVRYRNLLNGKRDIDLFDYVEFLNSGKRKLT